MKFGYGNSVGDAYIKGDRNRVVYCTASNATSAVTDGGFVDGVSLLGLTADQSIPDSTDTAVIWTHVTNSTDGLGFLTAGSTASLTFPYAGRFHITVTTPFNSNATGNRSCYPTVNSSRIPGQRDIRNAVTGSETTPNLDFIWDFAANDVLQIIVNQTSGGALDVNGSDAEIFVTDLNSPQQIVLAI